LLTDEEISLAAIHLLRIERKYDIHSHTSRVYASGRFRKTVTRYLPKLPKPGTALFRAASGTNGPGQRTSEQLAMFRITAESCRRFLLAEIIIMAAMNVETTRLASGGRVRSVTAAKQRGYLSASHFLRTKVRKAL
jgi:hypothetical protein